MEAKLPKYAAASISPLTGPWNYNRWARDFQALAEYEVVWEAYAEENANVMNDFAMGLLKLSLDPAIRATIPSGWTPHETWVHLEIEFKLADDNVYAIATTRMEGLRLRHFEGIAEYVKQHYQLQADIRNVGRDFDERSMIRNIAYGLSADYGPLVAREDIRELLGRFGIGLPPSYHVPPNLLLLYPREPDEAANENVSALNIFIGELLLFEARFIPGRRD